LRLRTWWMMCALVVVSSPALAYAMQNEPGEFLGIEWGASIDKYRGDLKLLMEDGDSGHYSRLSDRPFFAGVEVRRISYYFYKGRFTSGTYTTVGSTEFKNIVSYLTSRHGEPKTSRPRQRVYVWEGEHTGVIVSCDISISCYTEFYDKALRGEATEAHDTRREDD
jgi:hypothetical protein